MKSTKKKLSKHEKILLVCYKLANQQQHRNPIKVDLQLDRIIINAWNCYPKDFGFQIDSDSYPCSKSVSAYIMGKRGLTGNKNALIKVAKNTYRLTPLGKEMGMKLAGHAPNNKPISLTLNSSEMEVLKRLLKYRAAAMSNRVSFSEAMAFWGLDLNNTKLVDTQLSILIQTLQSIRGRFLSTPNGVLKIDKYTITYEAFMELLDLHCRLQVRFGQALEVLKRRGDAQAFVG